MYTRGSRRTDMRQLCFFFQAEDGIRVLVRSRGLGDVYKETAPIPHTRPKHFPARGLSCFRRKDVPARPGSPAAQHADAGSAPLPDGRTRGSPAVIGAICDRFAMGPAVAHPPARIPF